MKKLPIFISFLVVLIASILSVQLVSTVFAGVSDNLVSYWKFDEGVADTCVGSEDLCDAQGSADGERAGSGGANNLPQWDGIVKPTLSTSNPYAMNFDGSDDRITGIGDINFSGNAFSVTTWIRPESWGDSGDAYIHNLLCDETAAASTFCFRIGSQGNSTYRQRIALMVYDTSPNDYESTSNLSLDTWQHVAVTFDGSNVRFYIGGTLNRTQPASITMNDGVGGFNIAASNTGERNYDGSMDELRVYDRAITEDEVKELAGVNPGIDTLSPVDDSTDIAKDSNLVATFNRDMQAVASKNITIKKTSDDSTVETIAADNTSLVTVSSSTVTIDPSTNLEASTEYYVLIDSGAFTDLSANIYTGISDTTTWSFTTAADPTPTPTSTPAPSASPTPTPSTSPTATPSPTPAVEDSSNSTDDSSNLVAAPVCSNAIIDGKPDLFQIDTTENTASIYFTPILGNSNYFISYSDENSNAEQHGVEVDLGSLGVQSYTVKLLNPGKTYYFKVRGQNGCMPGEWSNIKQITTTQYQELEPEVVEEISFVDEVIEQETIKTEIELEDIEPVEVSQKNNPLETSIAYLKRLTGSVKGVSTSILENAEEKVEQVGPVVSTKVDSFEERINETKKQIALGQRVKNIKNGVSKQLFVTGEKMQDVSDDVGLLIVNFGYALVDEPTTISGVKVLVLSPTQAEISWQTNQPATGKVNYGLDESYEYDTQTTKLSKEHEFILDDLKPSTTYHFEVMSQAKTYVYDANRKFNTPER